MTEEQRLMRRAEHEWSCEGRVEQCARIVALEELALDMLGWVQSETCSTCFAWEKCAADESGKCIFWDEIEARMRALGMEVPR